MKNLDLLKRVKERTLEKVIDNFGGHGGMDLKEMKLSIWDVKCILYQEVNKIAKEVFEEEFK